MCRSIALLITCGLTACAASPQPAIEMDPARVESAPFAAAARAVTDQPGLIVERLRIRPDQPRPDALLASIEALDSDLDGVSGFRSQGFQAVVISAAEFERLESSFPASSFAGRTWHGEATGWRSAASRRLAEGSAMLVEGRSRRISDQMLALAVRGWSIPTIDGSQLHIELVPHLAGGRLDLLKAPRQLGELRGTMLCEVLTCTLDEDEILLLVSASDLEPGTTETPEASTEPPPEVDDRSSDGPVVALPPTAAGWLIDDPISGDRGVLVIHGRPHPAFRPPNEVR